MRSSISTRYCAIRLSRHVFRPEYDSGEHVHPNDLGHRALADAIDLKLFRPEAD
jgi:hypothetical protein